jgi:outer membrane protein
MAFLAAAQAPAADTPAPTKIGIINIQQAIAETNEGRRDFKDLEAKFEPRRTELQSDSTEVDNLKKQLSTQGDKLNDAARADLERNIATKTKSLQRKLEDAQSDWGTQQTEVINRIGQKMLEVINKYASDNGYLIIFDVSAETSPVVFAYAGANVTAAIVESYNAQSTVPQQPGAAPKALAPAKSSLPAAPSATLPKK